MTVASGLLVHSWGLCGVWNVTSQPLSLCQLSFTASAGLVHAEVCMCWTEFIGQVSLGVLHSQVKPKIVVGGSFPPWR